MCVASDESMPDLVSDSSSEGKAPIHTDSEMSEDEDSTDWKPNFSPHILFNNKQKQLSSDPILKQKV